MFRNASLGRRKRALGSRRAGAAVLEVVLVLIPFLTASLAILDLGVGVFRYHLITQGARHVARRAIVHGDTATALGEWGPTTIDELISATDIPAIDDSVEGVAQMLIGCDPNLTSVRIEWPNGNEVNDDVTVTITTQFQPVLGWIFSGSAVTFTAVSTMQVAH